METTTALKHVALNDTHIALGGKMVPFAGYSMPVQYKGLIEEHHCVRNQVGVFDVSHMGEFRVRGAKALDLLQKVTSNDVSKLFDGKVQYSCLPNTTGGIVDDLLVYRVSETEYYLVVNASNIEKDWNWISGYNEAFGCALTNESEATSLLAIQGPDAIRTLQKLTDMDLGSMEYYSFKIGRFAGHDNILISTTGYTGAGGCEVYFPNHLAQDIWNSIFEAGAEFGIQPIGLGARDTLRLEMGFCLYGNDIDDTTSPLEAGLGWITKFTKDFVNSAALRAQKEAGVTRKLVGLELTDKGIPRHGYEIANASGEIVGVVTSGTQSPTLGKPIGMGYVPSALAAPGSEIFIQVRGKALRAVVCKVPFIGK
ncbi:MAG: glycine cleavage system aminomethyltransferase GcvT [Flavobacteriales bacterium]